MDFFLEQDGRLLVCKLFASSSVYAFIKSHCQIFVELSFSDIESVKGGFISTKFVCYDSSGCSIEQQCQFLCLKIIQHQMFLYCLLIDCCHQKNTFKDLMSLKVSFSFYIVSDG